MESLIVTIFGCGSFGTALAFISHNAGHKVKMFGRK